MQCVYQMIDNQVFNSNLTSDFAFIEALDVRNFYFICGAYYFLPVSALQSRALKIKVVIMTFNVSPIHTTYCMAVLFTRFIIKHLGFQPNNSCTSINSWTAPPLCPYFKQTRSEAHSKRSQSLSRCGFVNNFSSWPNYSFSSTDWKKRQNLVEGHKLHRDLTFYSAYTS